MKTSKRVVITGMTSMNPFGFTRELFLEGLKTGKSAVGLLDLFPSDKFPNRVVAQVNSELLDIIAKDSLEYPDFFFDRKTVIGIATIQKSFADLQYDFHSDSPDELGISLGIGINNVNFQQLIQYYKLRNANQALDFYRNIIANHQPTQPSCDYAARWIRTHFNFRGPVFTNLSACAASTQAIGTAFRWIRRGKVKMALTGGVDSIINPIGIAGFSLLGTLSGRNDEPQKASRPFDLKRDGFVPGEGAGILFLEELEHALARKAEIYGEIVGYGSSLDAYHVTAPCKNGTGAALSMENALKDACWTVGDPEYINAHGTSTYLNDLVETKAIKTLFQEKAEQIPVSSCKSQIGHLIAASGAVEVIACVLAINHGFLPGNINLEEPDPECNLSYLKKPTDRKISKFLKNSFAFGGQNATLAIQVLHSYAG